MTVLGITGVDELTELALIAHEAVANAHANTTFGYAQAVAVVFIRARLFLPARFAHKAVVAGTGAVTFETLGDAFVVAVGDIVTGVTVLALVARGSHVALAHADTFTTSGVALPGAVAVVAPVVQLAPFAPVAFVASAVALTLLTATFAVVVAVVPPAGGRELAELAHKTLVARADTVWLVSLDTLRAAVAVCLVRTWVGALAGRATPGVGALALARTFHARY